jgi:hypothetical protein
MVARGDAVTSSVPERRTFLQIRNLLAEEWSALCLEMQDRPDGIELHVRLEWYLAEAIIKFHPDLSQMWHSTDPDRMHQTPVLSFCLLQMILCPSFISPSNRVSRERPSRLCLLY